MTDKLPYEIIRQGKVEYVVVFCPKGHECIGQKVSDVKAPQDLVCPNVKCKCPWQQILPITNGLSERNP